MRRCIGKRVRLSLEAALVFGGLAVVSVIGGSPPASASTTVTLYVAPSGTGDCTSAAVPCGSIQQAITTAEGGTYRGDHVTIDVAAGTYTENDTIDVPSHESLTIAGAGASTTRPQRSRPGARSGNGHVESTYPPPSRTGIDKPLI
jgi:hypothetical protein